VVKKGPRLFPEGLLLRTRFQSLECRVKQRGVRRRSCVEVEGRRQKASLIMTPLDERVGPEGAGREGGHAGSGLAAKEFI